LQRGLRLAQLLAIEIQAFAQIQDAGGQAVVRNRHEIVEDLGLHAPADRP